MNATLEPSHVTVDGVERTPCQLADPDLWFATAPEVVATAVQLCGQCPVLERCLAVAMRIEGGQRPSSRYGVWGGLTAEQRYRLSRTHQYRKASARQGVQA